MVLPKTKYYTERQEAGANMGAPRRSRKLEALKEGEGAKVYFGGMEIRGAPGWYKEPSAQGHYGKWRFLGKKEKGTRSRRGLLGKDNRAQEGGKAS